MPRYSMQVLNPQGDVLASAHLVGREQLPVCPRDGPPRKGAGPALSGAAGECAFCISSADRDWGVAVAVSTPGEITRQAPPTTFSGWV